MSNSVIICGVRGPNGVDLAALKQMAGRAGRSRKDQNAIVHIVAENECLNALKCFEQTPSVSSVYDADENVSFHLLGKIDDETVRDISDAKKWFSRSLSCAQGKSVDFNKIFNDLKKCEAIEQINGKYFVARIGKVALQCYFSPSLVYKWRVDFESIYASGDEKDPFAVAWALSSGMVSYDMETSGGNEILGQFPSEYKCVGSRGCEEVMWYAILNHITLRGVGTIKQSLKENLGRIKLACHLVGVQVPD